MNQILLSLWLRNPWLWLGLGLAAVVLRGLFIDVMDVDASQYASISMEMLQQGHWLQVMHRGSDYLDKPPLLFWASATSLGAFGLSNWAYKLPSALVAFGGVWAVYRFGLLYYMKETARHAAFILASSVGFLLICNDVRTDTLLLGTTALAVWQFAEYLQHNQWRNGLAAFFFMGLAMLAKGPIGLVMPAFAVGSHLLWQRDWRNLFRWEWLAGLVVTALVLAPMCWGLWQQFDLHPERTVNGRTGVSGLYFFFWEQSFGRITGENVWKNDTSGLYFLHVYLWAFLPWSLLLTASGLQVRHFVVSSFRHLWSQLLAATKRSGRSEKHLDVHTAPQALSEVYSTGGFLLTFMALSLSKYKLPHYVFITLPWAAILVARYIDLAFGRERDNKTRLVWWLFYLPIFTLAAGAFLSLGFVFPSNNLVVWGVAVSIFGWLGWRIFQYPFPEDADVVVQRGVLATVGAMFVLNFHFYPHLLPYQSTSAAAQFAQKNGIPAEKMAHYGRHGHALDFYSRRILPDMPNPTFAQETADRLGELWLYTTVAGRADLERDSVPYTLVKEFQHFQVALLSAEFLNPTTRNKELEPIFLLKLSRQERTRNYEL